MPVVSAKFDLDSLNSRFAITMVMSLSSSEQVHGPGRAQGKSYRFRSAERIWSAPVKRPRDLPYSTN